MSRTYMCIDLKSFYASVECVLRGLDPLSTNLVVADSSRTEKTICLAVSPSLKKYGIPGRARLFEVVQKLREINYNRKKDYNIGKFIGKSYDDKKLDDNKRLEIDYIVAEPRMGTYIEYSTKIYSIYLKYLDSEDIHVYSIDEVFCDITDYLTYYGISANELVTKIINDVYDSTGITATAGIGTNLYLAKVAMDIVAKHIKPNDKGARIAYLDEEDYKKLLWQHQPITDFWRVGRGYSKKLYDNNMYTMGDVARCSIENEDLLYRLFGINAELLIDHAWGYEPCTISNIKNYKPDRSSLGSGQVLHCPYSYEKAMIVVKEMADSLSLDLVSKNMVTNQIVLTIGYDIDNNYNGEYKMDWYGRRVPKSAHGTINIDHMTSSSKIIIANTIDLYKRIVDKKLAIRRINIAAVNVLGESKITDNRVYKQFSLFDNGDKEDRYNKDIKSKEIEDKKLQQTILDIKNKYGKNSILKGIDLKDGATAISRNGQIGGHKG